jgi:hypothetical protein
MVGFVMMNAFPDAWLHELKVPEIVRNVEGHGCRNIHPSGLALR